MKDFKIVEFVGAIVLTLACIMACIFYVESISMIPIAIITIASVVLMISIKKAARSGKLKKIFLDKLAIFFFTFGFSVLLKELSFLVFGKSNVDILITFISMFTGFILYYTSNILIYKN